MPGSASREGATKAAEPVATRGAPRARALYAAVVAARALFSRLPVPLARRLGRALGRLYGRIGGPRTSDAAINLRIAFPEWDEPRRARVLVESCASWGEALAEIALLHGRRRAEIVARVRLEIEEPLAQARRLSGQQGVILLTAHFGAWELAGAAIALAGHPLTVVHRAPRDPQLARLVREAREACGIEVLTLGEAGLGVLSALRRGRLVAMLLDQDAARAEGAFAPFFSLPASTRVAPAAIALRRRFAVLPAFSYRVGDGHVVRADAPLLFEPAPDEVDGGLGRAVTRMNEAIETAVRRAPDHWLWPHRRWRTRPEGEAQRLYPSRRQARPGGAAPLSIQGRR